jgi:hypothetical protein
MGLAAVVLCVILQTQLVSSLVMLVCGFRGDMSDVETNQNPRIDKEQDTASASSLSRVRLASEVWSEHAGDEEITSTPGFTCDRTLGRCIVVLACPNTSPLSRAGKREACRWRARPALTAAENGTTTQPTHCHRTRTRHQRIKLAGEVC